MKSQDRSVDKYSPKKRSEIMSKVSSTNTKPEIIIRRKLHALGYRYRLHLKNLPGKPDIVLPKCRTVIFVNGCFWHQHPGCKKATIPKTHENFWKQKLLDNVDRDKSIAKELESSGWNIITAWECEINKNQDEIISHIDAQLKLNSSH